MNLTDTHQQRMANMTFASVLPSLVGGADLRLAYQRLKHKRAAFLTALSNVQLLVRPPHKGQAEHQQRQNWKISVATSLY